MKITLDIDKLLADQKITTTEYEKLKEFSKEGGNHIIFNLLIGFGVIAVSISTILLIPNPLTIIAVGALVFLLGLVLTRGAHAQWKLLSQMCILIGALLTGAGIVALDDGQARSYMALVAIYTIGGIMVNSSLLVVLAVLSISPVLGAATAYEHARYTLMISEPTLTICVFGVIAALLFWVSKRVPIDYERIAIHGSRTAVLMANMGFWIGSLWGDRLEHAPLILNTPLTFSIAWAVALIAVGIFAWHIHRLWLLNTVAVFGAIHFYTQWFEHLGAAPMTVLMGGLIALGIALLIKQINVKMKNHTMHLGE